MSSPKKGDNEKISLIICRKRGKHRLIMLFVLLCDLLNQFAFIFDG